MYTYIATFNARTLRTENKRKELFHFFDSQSITILGVIDHRIVHNESDDDIVYNQVNSSLFITSSAWRNDVNAAVGGVGIMINKRASNVLSEVTKWNERIIIATFDGNPKTTPTKKSFHRSSGIPVEFHWSHGKLLENDWNKWNLWNSSEIPLEFQQFIILFPLKFHL